MKGKKLTAIISTFIVCFIMWLAFTWSFDIQELAFGAVVSLFVAMFSARFFIHNDAWYLFNPKRLVMLIYYCFIIFPIELIKSNIDVAKRAFSPKLNINPGIIKVPVSLKSEYGLSMLANSITLTPGTITMEVTQEDDDKNYLYIQWIDVVTKDQNKAGELIKGKLERCIGRVWN